jgi:hypothetical protein
MLLHRAFNKIGIRDDDPKRREEREMTGKKKGRGEEEEKRREGKLRIFMPQGGQANFLIGKDTVHWISHEVMRCVHILRLLCIAWYSIHISKCIYLGGC